MAKKTDQITSHLQDGQRAKLEKIAHMEGFADVSSYIRHLANAAIDEKYRQYETLASIFSDGENSANSESAQRAVAQFMRVATQEAEPLQH